MHEDMYVCTYRYHVSLLLAVNLIFSDIVAKHYGEDSESEEEEEVNLGSDDKGRKGHDVGVKQINQQPQDVLVPDRKANPNR